MSEYRIYVAKSELIPRTYLGINIPFFVILLLPAQNLVVFLTVLVFLIATSLSIYHLLAKQLVSDMTIMVDQDRKTVSLPNKTNLGVMGSFSYVTSRFAYIGFNHQSFKANRLIFLNKLNNTDRKRLIRAVYGCTK